MAVPAMKRALMIMGDPNKSEPASFKAALSSRAGRRAGRVVTSSGMAAIDLVLIWFPQAHMSVAPQ